MVVISKEELLQAANESLDQLQLTASPGSPADDACLTRNASKLKKGGTLKLSEAVWIWPNGMPPADLAPMVRALTSPKIALIRSVEAMRKSIIFAGLECQGAPEIQPLGDHQLQKLLSVLFPSLAGNADKAPSPEQSDALLALGVLLKPHLAWATAKARKPDFAQGVSFSLRSRKPVEKLARQAPPLDAWSAAAKAPQVRLWVWPHRLAQVLNAYFVAHVRRVSSHSSVAACQLNLPVVASGYVVDAEILRR
eukprot:6209065-Pleurochrysis_carterae.AAC.2